jgi:hypothetical protein
MKAREIFTRHLANRFEVEEQGIKIDIGTHRHTINVEIDGVGFGRFFFDELTVQQFYNILATGSTTSLVTADELRKQLLVVAAERDSLAEKLERVRQNEKDDQPKVA